MKNARRRIAPAISSMTGGKRAVLKHKHIVFVGALLLQVLPAAADDTIQEIGDRCGTVVFHGRHAACFGAGLADLPNGQRTGTLAVTVQRLMALLDEQGSDVPPDRTARNRVERCGQEESHARHAACFDTRIAAVPAERRSGLDGLRRELTRLDDSERHVDETFLGARRIETWHAKVRELTSGKLTAAEFFAGIRELCRGGSGEPAIGMTEVQAVATAWCVPVEMNETITAGHTRRQYVYLAEYLGRNWGSGRVGYLYFDNGILVAIQR